MLQSMFFFFFLLFSQLGKHPFIDLLHLFNLLQMSNDCRVVNVEFFGNFSCSFKRISFDDWSLSTSDVWPLCSSSSRLSPPLPNFLSHYRTVCSLAVPGPNMLWMLQVVSATLQPILNLNKKIA